jgi:diguanylate cyclase (GGDEF)-like protein
VRVAAVGLDEARENLRAARQELIARHQQIAHLAHHDALTDLPNRTALQVRLADTLARAKATETGFAVLSVDLDYFKEANDIFGHVVGDELLCAIARRLEAAASDAFIARVGGDEFMVVTPVEPLQGQVEKALQRLNVGERLPGSAGKLANRLLNCITEEFEIRGQQIQIGLSIGGAIYPTDASEVRSLLANADAALYRAKADGRQMVRFFDPEMDRRLRERYSLQHDLRSALSHEELVLNYQPQATIDGEVFGFEALLRWFHPKLGYVPPNEFIGLAEQNGTINEIGAWVLRQACREAASWQAPLKVGVNLSPVQFRHGDLAGLVHMILLETGLAPNRLELEITEGVLIGDTSRALSILRRLKLLGVRIAMDDFGTGYASLSSLQSFPFDKVKIDRSFIAGVDSNVHAAAIVRAVLGLGKAFNIPTIAEGVETEGERLFLLKEGCQEIQGYLVGRPAPIASYADITNGDVSTRLAG